ncbi:MAG: response regulator [Clostridia bacterium]|nr:response regulator [Clostridia bacterium]
MKKTGIIIVNILIMVLILAFVSVYTVFSDRSTRQRQTEHFENTTVAMERVTENYLEGEQRVCDVWARYINSREMTMEEAAAYIRVAHVAPNASAHLIDLESKAGVSTRAHLGSEDDFAVSYKNMEFLNDISWISDVSESVNISRAYTNPMNGEQSIAFCNRITLHDPDGGGAKEAVLLRVLPISELEQKWIFPQEEFENAEITLIDYDGDYIIKSRSFKNSNFFEFYKSYNPSDPALLEELHGEITSATGSRTIRNSRGEEMLLAYTPIADSVEWTLLSLIPEADLSVNIQNWPLIGSISFGLLVLFLIDLIFIQSFNKKLRIAAREAEEANKAKTDFLSTMSHDIRTPMNAIIGLTTIAQKKLGDTEATGECLRKIGLAGNHLLTLINDILDISKVESGKLVLTPVTFSLVETVENLVNLSQPMVKEKNIDFNFRIDRIEKEYLYADNLRLNQIYINILSNAVKYTEPGGSVSVDLREEESPVAGSVRLTYRVSDTGIGMTPEFMARMFQPFSRQTDSRVNSIQGTGLGLAITKKMVDLMGGTIDCQSAPGKGTTFTVVIDIPAAARQREELRLDPVDVLVVDDDELLLQTTSETLSSLGAAAECAAGGEKAVEMIAERRRSGRQYDLVILDWKMPGMNGVETARRIREEADGGIPILLMSAYDVSEIEEDAKKAGADGFVAKPLFRSTLYDKINQLLGKENTSVEPEDDYSDLDGIRVLVAEDNDVNWEIIQAMLGMFGVAADRAENGRVCVEKVRTAEKGRYTLIFMDVQMPEMNGLDATRAIRALTDPEIASIPIVAMTADAFSENVAECLNAGMNGHIAKPVDVKLVIKEIRKITERKNEQ